MDPFDHERVLREVVAEGVALDVMASVPAGLGILASGVPTPDANSVPTPDETGFRTV